MRNLDILILSDVHLGTHGCQAEELLHYLHTVQPKHVILNGDLIDFWQFNKRFWPASHMAVVNHLLGWLKKGIQIDYICGNHDEVMRRFVGFTQGRLSILNQVILEQNGKKVWIFHGDALDGSMKNKWLAKWGGRWYDRSIRANKALNRLLVKLGFKPVQISKAMKDGVKRIVNKKFNWQDNAAKAAVDAGYDVMAVGHNHKPEIREIQTENGAVLYLNSGDWLENLTSLEYVDGNWSLYKHDAGLVRSVELEKLELELSDEAAFQQMLFEMGLTTSRA